MKKFSKMAVGVLALVLALSPVLIYSVEARANAEGQGLRVEVFHGEGSNVSFAGRPGTAQPRPHTKNAEISPLAGNTPGWALLPGEAGGVFMRAFDEYGRYIPLPSFDDVFGLGRASLEAAIAEAFVTELSIEDVANLDYYEALPHVQNLILRARYEVVFCYAIAWTVDGQMSILTEDGTLEALPEFAGLFPGWDLAKIESISTHDFTNVGTYNIGESVQRMMHLFRASGTIHRQQADVNAPVFASVTNQFPWWNTMQVQLTQMNWPIGGVNIGITDMRTGLSVGWRGNMVPGQSIIVDVGPGASAGVRASTVDNSGFVVIDGFQW